MSKQYKYIGSSNPLVAMLATVTLKVPKSDGTYLIVDNIVPNDTVITIDDPVSIKYMDADSKYESQ